MTRPLPQPPTFRGIAWRPAKVGDVEAIVALQKSCFDVDGGHREAASEIEARWESDDSDAEEDSLLAVKDDGKVVAVAWSYVPSIATTKWRGFHDNYVHPDYRSTDLPEFVLDWWEARCEQRFGAKDDALPRYLWSLAYDSQLDKIDFLESHGYSAMRYYDELVRDLSGPIEVGSIPDGMTVQTWADAPLSDSLVVHNASFTDHWGSQPLSEARWAHKESEFRLPAASYVMYDGDEPVGYLMSAAYPHDFEDKGRSEAWVEGLGTVPSHRKQGVASALVALAMGSFRSLGLEYATLGVDSENASGAYHLYEALGFVRDRCEIAYVKELTADPE